MLWSYFRDLRGVDLVGRDPNCLADQTSGKGHSTGAFLLAGSEESGLVCFLA